MKDKKIVFILGMHRSGTSALASTIENLGISLGNKTTHTDFDNPQGYFENEDFVKFNEELLSYFNTRWDIPFFDCKKEMNSKNPEELEAWIKKATEILIYNCKNTEILAIKDPRNSILLPFWEKVFSSNKIPLENIFYICIFRNPSEVALSQIKRFHSSPDIHFLGNNAEEVFVLWFHYYVYMFKNTSIPRMLLIDYKNLIGSPVTEVERVCSFLNYKNETKASLPINKNLYRNKSEKQHLKPECINELHKFLIKMSLPPFLEVIQAKEFILSKIEYKDTLELNSSFSQYIFRFSERFFSTLKDVNTLKTEITGLNESISELNKRIDQVEHEKISLSSCISSLEGQKSHLICSQNDLVNKLNNKHNNELNLLRAYHKNLLKSWSEKYSTIAIYGAGEHTKWLLKVFKEINLSPVAVYDDTPKCDYINEVPVYPFSDLKSSSCDAVITSSETHHSVMSKKLLKLVPHIKILNPYEECELTPFSKTYRDHKPNA